MSLLVLDSKTWRVCGLGSLVDNITRYMYIQQMVKTTPTSVLGHEMDLVSSCTLRYGSISAMSK